MSFEPFDDAVDFPDELWDLIDPINARSPAETHFIRVMLFHGDFLNGGFNQAIFNIKQANLERIEEYVNSFKAIGLHPFATIISLAMRKVAVGEVWQSVFGRAPSDLDKIYVAMTYALPWADEVRFQEFIDSAGGADGFSDWVAKVALKYARDNIGDFSNLRDLWRSSRA